MRLAFEILFHKLSSYIHSMVTFSIAYCVLYNMKYIFLKRSSIISHISLKSLREFCTACLTDIQTDTLMANGMGLISSLAV